MVDNELLLGQDKSMDDMFNRREDLIAKDSMFKAMVSFLVVALEELLLLLLLLY